MTNHRRPGDVVIVRQPFERQSFRVYEELTGDHVANVPGWPYVVIEDSDDVVALFLPEGTKLWRWDVEARKLREPAVTRGDSVRLLYPGRPYAVDLFFESGSGPAPWVDYLYFGAGPPSYPSPTREPAPALPRPISPPVGHFYGWKVDLVTPLTRTASGFDVIDQVLDIVVFPDRRWYWKDVEQMERFVASGIYSQAEADALFAAGEEAIALIEAAAPPFDSDATAWLPKGRPPAPEAPDGWYPGPWNP